MSKVFYDTETVGFHGVCVLIQYQFEGEHVQLYSPWLNPVGQTLELVERMMECDNIGFNLTFDHFHLSKLYTMLRLLPADCCPLDQVGKVVAVEKLARDGPCVKPKRACDVMLHARKGKFQSTMNRKGIRIKKIHGSVVQQVAEYLERTIEIPPLYFAKAKSKQRWTVVESKDARGWFDIVLNPKPSSALKVLAKYALGYEDVDMFDELDSPPHPLEVGYAPFAEALSSEEKGWEAEIKKGSTVRSGLTWPGLIHDHVQFWTTNLRARKYAEKDVTITRELWEHLGSPEPGDNDSELACMVGANRWRGYSVDLDAIESLEAKLEEEAVAAPIVPAKVKSYIYEVLSPIELKLWDNVAKGSTKRTVLEKISEWDSPGGKRAAACLLARQSKYTLDMLHKLKLAGRFHASADVLGTLSGRVSGSGGDFNSQGIGRGAEIRNCFKLSWGDEVLGGGDFSGFEVAISIAAFGDKKLEQIIHEGKSVHGMFGKYFFPEMSYEEIVANKELYMRCKSGLFALIYGGEAYTLKERLNVTEENAEKAFSQFMNDHVGLSKGRQEVTEKFSALSQAGEIGTAITYREPQEAIETMFGFKRFFALENQLIKEFYNIASNPPEAWKNWSASVTRRKKPQTMRGAICSAFYAAAFSLQSSNIRAAGNHLIQGAGAHICKTMERNIWDLQPHGVHPWKVQPLNEHDEIMSPCAPDMVELQKKVVQDTIESFRPKVPLLQMDWKERLNSWAEK